MRPVSGWIGLGLGLLAWAAPGPVLAQGTPESAEKMPLAAQRSLVLGVAEGSSRAIAVGERGHILVSESRSEWRQVDSVPTRATLTAVDARGDKAWAVGHDGIILHSSDGGLSWSIQREDRWTQESFDAPDWTPRSGAPLLDVLFIDESRGYAVGAYTQLLATVDGGANWSPVALQSPASTGAEEDDAAGYDASTGMLDADDLILEEESDPHLNGIARSAAGIIMIVGERGAGFRSLDDGATWERISLPYEGSMFGVLALGDRHFLAYGLRGNVLETRDGGNSWEELDSDSDRSLLGGVVLPDGGALLVGVNGVLMYRASAESDFALATFENSNSETPSLSSALPLGARTFLLAGDKGIERYEVRN